MNPRFSSEGFPQGASSTAGLTGHPVTWMFRLPAMGRVRLWLLVLQSCRPYSGAVICMAPESRRPPAPGFNRAAPYRGGYPADSTLRTQAAPRFNRAAPIPGRLCCNARMMPNCVNCFNCAAPIPGRLSGRRPLLIRPLLSASIVPPPFRGGYRGWPRTSGFGLRHFNCAAPITGRLCWTERDTIDWMVVLQSCRPYSGAVIWGMALITAVLDPTLQSCRPYSRVVINATVYLIPPRQSRLQSCRPYSGAVIGGYSRRIKAAERLQSCRPHSGAVIWSASAPQ